jgi:hypothetical protein
MQQRLYALILVAMLLLCCIVNLAGRFVLYRARETMAPADLVDQQRKTGGLYFGLASPVGSYKLAAYSLRKPEILILGSSRAHRQHQEFYNRSSYAMSGAVYSTEMAIQIVDLLIPIHKPRFLIYNLDFYNLCRMSPYAGSLEQFDRPKGLPNGVAWQSVNQFAVVPKLLVSGVLSLKDVLDFTLGRFAYAVDGIPLFGLIGIKKHLGFGSDGAVSELEGEMQDAATFEREKQDIIKGANHYPAGCFYDPMAAANLKFLQQETYRQGIKLVILLPPISPTMYRLFMTTRADIGGYYKAWLEEYPKLGLRDLHVLVDGESIGAPDSEFSDAVHGGDISEARMLLKAAASPGSALAEIINRPFLERLIRERAGTVAVELAYFRSAREALASATLSAAK